MVPSGDLWPPEGTMSLTLSMTYFCWKVVRVCVVLGIEAFCRNLL